MHSQRLITDQKSTTTMAEIRQITSLPLPPSMISKLIDHGFNNLIDLVCLQPFDLAQELNISNEDAFMILKVSCNEIQTNRDDEYCGHPLKENIEQQSYTFLSLFTKITTAKDVYNQNEKELRPIVTWCKNIDKMLGGGIMIGQLTEICGVPGIGKTQMATQLALNVQIPLDFGGVGGDALYIDCEGSFSAKRAATMASNICGHLKKVSMASIVDAKRKGTINNNNKLNEKMDIAKSMTMESLLSGIKYRRVHDQTELLANINHLTHYLSERPKIKLIIIDSIAFFFRQSLDNIPMRTRLLSSVAQILQKVAHEHKVAVLVINHMTTRIDKNTVTDNNTRVLPALGEQWSHWITTRILMFWDYNHRCAKLVKSQSRAEKSATFQVSDIGVRDIKDDNNNGSSEQRNKRLRTSS